MTTKLDISSTSVVILCSECPWWRGFRLTVDTAHNCAVDHEAAVHPGAVHAIKARHALHAARARRISDAARHAG